MLVKRDEARRSVTEAENQLHRLRKEVKDLNSAFAEVNRLMDSARVNVEVVRRAVEEAQDRAESALEMARRANEFALQAREEFDAICREWRATIPEARSTSLSGKPRSGTPTAAEAPSSFGGASSREVSPDRVALRVADSAVGTRERLIGFLNDAWSVEKEQADLLQNLADSTDDPVLRSELEEHRTLSQRHQASIGELVRSLGAEPAGGILGAIVARLWEELQKPRGETDELVEVMLKALSAVEFEVGMYLSVYSLARAIGDEEAAELAAQHLNDERNFAGRLRHLIAPTLVPPAEGPVGDVPGR